jgi:hypothetical protein
MRKQTAAMLQSPQAARVVMFNLDRLAASGVSWTPVAALLFDWAKFYYNHPLLANPLTLRTHTSYTFRIYFW